jgi:hypothetical protein
MKYANRYIKTYICIKVYIYRQCIACFIWLVIIFLQLDFSSFLININTVNQLDWSFDSSLNFDPVRDAAAQNAAAAAGTSSSNLGNSSGGGPSQPQMDMNSPGRDRTTDTTRLGDYLSKKCAEGNSVYNCLDVGPNTTITNPNKVFCSRIWAHVKAEHPEFANNYPYNATTVNDSTLWSNIYSLNKNYPGNWP